MVDRGTEPVRVIAHGQRPEIWAIARGESSEAAAAGVAKGRPNARVLIREAGGIVTVSVLEVVSIPLPLFEGLEMTITQDAAARRETPATMEVPDASG